VKRWCRSFHRACLPKLLRDQALSTDQCSRPVAGGGTNADIHGWFQSASAPVLLRKLSPPGGGFGWVPVSKRRSAAEGMVGDNGRRAGPHANNGRRLCWAGLAALWRYPVKCAWGKSLAVLSFGQTGGCGDRRLGLWDHATSRVATAKEPAPLAVNCSGYRAPLQSGGNPRRGAHRPVASNAGWGSPTDNPKAPTCSAQAPDHGRRLLRPAWAPGEPCFDRAPQDASLTISTA